MLALSRTFKGAADNGLKERLLFVYPDVEPLPWNRDAKKHDRDRADALWANIINPLYELEARQNDEGVVESVCVEFSADAEDQLFHWNEVNTKRKKALPKSAALLGKADIICPRLALILQLMDDPGSNVITDVNAARAINMIEYFLLHSKKVMQVISEGPPEAPTPTKKLYDMLPDKFTTSEAIEYAEVLGKDLRTIKRYLKDETFFNRIDQGNYTKVH